MTNGGIFTIITNDGKQDRMLMATALLKMRLNRISKARARAGLDETPTLVDIEKTHVLFMNAHFKPFAAIGYEYCKVRPSSGTVTLNSTVQFSIPQFGDFFNDMVLHVRLGAVSASTAANTWRWCAWPGERLLDKVKFSVNGNALDEYYGHDYNFYRQFEIPAHKMAGYARCAGQQEVKEGSVIGHVALTDDATNAKLGENVTAFNANGYGFKVGVTTGYQTVKTGTAHAVTSEAGTNVMRTDILEVTMPLLFWFNKDPRLAVPSVSIPYGQRFIEVDLTALTNLCGGMRVTAVDDATVIGTSAVLSIASTQVPVCDLYVNNIFVNPEIHDIFIKRIGFNLIRVHKRQVNNLTSLASGELLLNNLKWPIESIYFGFRNVEQYTAPANNTSWSQTYADGWCNFASAETVTGGVRVGAATTSLLAAQWLEQIPLVQTVSFKAHGIPIYNEIPAIMYNQYLPFMFGEKLCTPTDPGAYCVLFNLHPGVYQPSGHINASRAREFYILYDDTIPSNARNLQVAADKVGGANNASCYLVASANCLNFLLISDGGAVLRYST